MPSNPDKVYRKNGWKGYVDWLGTGLAETRSPANKQVYWPFKKAHAAASIIGLSGTPLVYHAMPCTLSCTLPCTLTRRLIIWHTRRLPRPRARRAHPGISYRDMYASKPSC